MSKSKYIKAVFLRAVVLSALGCSGQVITAPASGVQGPDNAGKCWFNVPKTYQDLSFVERLAFKAACKKNANACDTSLFGSKKVIVACPVPPKPAVPSESKPAPATTKEICPQGMELGADENGKHLCSDGVHTAEPKKFTPLAPSTPAPTAGGPAPAAY